MPAERYKWFIGITDGNGAFQNRGSKFIVVIGSDFSAAGFPVVQSNHVEFVVFTDPANASTRLDYADFLFNSPAAGPPAAWVTGTMVTLPRRMLLPPNFFFVVNNQGTGVSNARCSLIECLTLTDALGIL